MLFAQARHCLRAQLATFKTCGHGRSIHAGLTSQLSTMRIRMVFIVYSSDKQQKSMNPRSLRERNDPQDSHQASEGSRTLRTRKRHLPQTRQRRIRPSTRISGPSNPACRPPEHSPEQTVHSPHIHTTQPLPTVEESLTGPTTTHLRSRLLTDHNHPQYCNPTMRAGMELVGFLDGPAWSASLSSACYEASALVETIRILVLVCVTSGAQ